MAQMPEAIILRKTEETKTGVTYCMADVKTNADRIRSMSDEELAEWFRSVCSPDNSCIGCKFDHIQMACTFDEWLKQEANS